MAAPADPRGGALPVLTVFADAPDRGRGLARDMRVRWALEEEERGYSVRTLDLARLRDPDHLARHPFGQIPVFEDGGLCLFESGAIVLHVAASGRVLLPAEPGARARALGWMFAATSTIEPAIVAREEAHYRERDRPWFAERLALVEAGIADRLAQLAARLGSGPWLDRDFSAGDLMMIDALRRLEGSGLLLRFPALAAYVARGEARPAFARAFAAQRALALSGQPGGPGDRPAP